MKVDPAKVVEEPVEGKRGRKSRDEEAKPKKSWKERDGFVNGARVRRKNGPAN
jgi:hypothetical protein